MDWRQRCGWIHEYWEETRMIGRNVSLPVVLQDRPPQPQGDSVQLHTDAAVDPRGGRAGYGTVITRTEGIICGALEFMDPTPLSPLAAEVNAIIHGIRLLQHMNISSVYVLSDFLSAIKMIQGELELTSDVHHWIIQIQRMILSFQNISFIHVSKKEI